MPVTTEVADSATTTERSGSKVRAVLLGEAMGEAELRLGSGFVGASGIELLRILDEAQALSLTAEDRSYISRFYNTGDNRCIDMIWRMHPEFHRSNVFQQHPPGNRIEAFCGPKTEGLPGYPALIKGKYVRREFKHELERLGDELVRVDPNLIICLGNTALWALAGTTGISKLRGTTCLSTHTATGFKLLPTYHPAAVLRQWELRPVTVIDCMKAKREMEYAEIIRPKREVWIEPGYEDFLRFYEEYIIGCDLLSVDIETAGERITEIGFAPSKDRAIVVPFRDNRKPGSNYWPTKELEQKVWLLIKVILEDRAIRMLFQNGLFDVAFIWRTTGIKCYGVAEDTMLLHHALQPESLKGLAFQGSVYTDEGPWKNMRKFKETIKRDD